MKKREFNLKQQLGFTLIELMIVIAIIGILYTVALPNYTTYIQKSRRADVQQVLMRQTAILERQYTRVGGYPESFVFPNSEYYTFSYDSDATKGNSDGSEFTLTAEPTGAQSTDHCGNLSIGQSGVKTAESAQCW